VKRAIIFGLALLAAGCAGGNRQPAVDVLADTRDSSCYTVDLFTKVEFQEPEANVPSDWRGFAGKWGGGKWGGRWCHDLYVLNVMPDGQVNIVETYAPYEPWGKRASAFRRTAQIDRDGRLRVAYGRVKMEYWLEDGELRGMREENGDRHLIALARLN
jgi:hypothetical protein